MGLTKQNYLEAQDWHVSGGSRACPICLAITGEDVVDVRQLHRYNQSGPNRYEQKLNGLERAIARLK